jgi:hypothetical protein
MSQLEVDKVIPQSGTTLTLGENGDTVSVPSGATLDASNATLTLPDDSVTTAKIADANITTAKLAYDPNPFRNIVINGDMSIAQRSTSVASITTNGYYSLDRMFLGLTGAGTWTQSQSTDVPTGEGFATSLKMDNTTANGSLSAGDNCIIQQRIEGQNLQYIKKGTASAISLTVSFWIKATKTGTNIVELYDNANTRQISASYTVNTTNTWEKKTVTFAGDTTGTLANNNSSALTLLFWLAAGTNFTSGTLSTTWTSVTSANRAVGQVNNADDTANDWYITGVQLEAGTTASEFEFLPVDVNLARCQRYYYGHAIGSDTFKPIGGVSYYSSSIVIGFLQFPSTMRTIPSLVSTSGVSFYRIDRNTSQNYLNSLTIVNTSENMTGVVNTTEASGTAGDSGWLYTNDASATVAFNAEL